MKRFLFLLAFALFTVTTVVAQCNNGNGYGYGNNGGNNNNGGGNNGGGGNSNNSGGGYNGGGNNNNNGGGYNNNSNNGGGYQAPSGITWEVASKCLLEAAPYFQQQLGLNFGQLVVKYLQGACTITLVATNPPTNNTYRVAIGGVISTVIIDIL